MFSDLAHQARHEGEGSVTWGRLIPENEGIFSPENGGLEHEISGNWGKRPIFRGELLVFDLGVPC